MKRFIILALCVAVILLGGCGKPAQNNANGKVTVVFWHSLVNSSIPALNELIKKFEDEHPDIQIKAQYIPTGDALLQKLITAVQSNTAPDISWIHANFMQNLIEANAIYPMDELMHGPDSLSLADMADIYPALVQQAQWRHRLYSLPMEGTNLGLVYNKRLFREAGLDPEKPPQTWDELRAYSKKLTIDKNGDGKFEQIGFFIPVFPASGPLGDYMVWQWFPFLWQAGGYEVDTAQQHMLFNSDAGVKALSLWQEIYEANRQRNFTPDYDAAFAGQQVAMVMDGPWNIPHYQGMKNLEWGTAPLPAGPAKRATVVGGEYLSIFRQSGHPQQAWTFVKWMMRPDVQAFWSMKSGYLPIRRSVLQVKEYQEFLKSNSALRAFVEQMEVGQSTRPVDYHGLEINHKIADAIEKATLGRMDAKTILDDAAREADPLLQPTQK